MSQALFFCTKKDTVLKMLPKTFQIFKFGQFALSAKAFGIFLKKIIGRRLSVLGTQDLHQHFFTVVLSFNSWSLGCLRPWLWTMMYRFNIKCNKYITRSNKYVDLQICIWISFSKILKVCSPQYHVIWLLISMYCALLDRVFLQIRFSNLFGQRQ